MGRRKKPLKLHKVKGYYTTYEQDGKTRYKYFGIHEAKKATRAFRSWSRRYMAAHWKGKTLDQVIQERTTLRKLRARFLLSLPDDYDESQRDMVRRWKRWLKEREKKGT